MDKSKSIRVFYRPKFKKKDPFKILKSYSLASDSHFSEIYKNLKGFDILEFLLKFWYALLQASFWPFIHARVRTTRSQQCFLHAVWMKSDPDLFPHDIESTSYRLFKFWFSEKNFILFQNLNFLGHVIGHRFFNLSIWGPNRPLNSVKLTGLILASSQ